MGQMQVEINAVIRKMEKAVTVFSKRDRRGLLTKAAAPVRKTLRNNTKFRARTARINVIRGKEYYPGNLKKSMKTLRKLKKTDSVFVGPEFGGRAGVTSYGQSSKNVDGFYFAMAYGGLRAYQSQLLFPSAAQSRSASIRAFKRDFIKRFGTRAAQQGLDVG